MAIPLADWLLTERGDPVVGANVSVARTDGAAFTYNAVSATSHATTTNASGYWEFAIGGGLPDLSGGAFYDVTITHGQQVRKRKGGIMTMLANLNLAQALTIGAGLLWDYTAALLRLPVAASDPGTPANGQVLLRSDTHKLRLRANGAWHYLVDEDTAATLTNKTLTSPTITSATLTSPAITGGTQSSPTITTPSITGNTSVTGRLTVLTADADGIGTAGSSDGVLEVQQNSGGGAAKVAFHRAGAFAGYFGLDTDNVWKVGGWSHGATSYPLVLGGPVGVDQIKQFYFHTSAAAVNLDGIGVGAVAGTAVFLKAWGGDVPVGTSASNGVVADTTYASNAFVLRNGDSAIFYRRSDGWWWM
jgi:hypothetical protein